MTTPTTGLDEGEHLRRGRRRVNLLTLGLAVTTVPLLAWLAQQPGRVDLGVAAVVGLLFLTGEIFTIDIEFRRESQLLTFIGIPLVVGLLILPPVVVVALRVVTLLAVFAAHRQPPYKLAFNACSAALDASIAAATIVLFVPDGSFGPRSWLVVFVAVVAGDAVSTLTTTTAISSFGGRWEPPSATDLWMGALVAFADVVIAVVLVTLFDAGEPAAVLVLGIGAFLLVLARAFARVTTRYRSLELLDRFTRALGGSVADGQVVERLLSESVDILHAERSWLIVRGPSQSSRLELDGGDVIVSAASPLDEALLDGLGDGAVMLGDGGPFGSEVSDAGIVEAIAARLPSVQGEDYALVVAERSGEVRPFDADDVALFDTLAVHAGLALQNLGLVDRLRAEIEVTEHLATHDVLTSLPNRMLFQQRVDAVLGRGRPAAVILIDLDRFKEVNDTLGHHNGDLLLVEAGRRLAAQIAGDDIVARLGGDEFAVLLASADEATAVRCAHRLLAELALPFELEAVSVDVSGSAGVAVTATGADDAATLLRHADVAMYVAKADHTAVEVYAADRDHYSPHRLALVGRLRSAIDDRKLRLHYQPQIDLRTGHVTGVEALVRWPQPGRAPIPPDEFIYVAEHTGLIHPLTQYVLEEAIAQASRWHHDGRGLQMSINLSAHNLTHLELVDEIARLARLGGVPLGRLRVELTETAVMTNPTRSVEIMEALRAIGVTIAIDDFGVGQSSLAYLTGVPADELKIDKSFVHAMGTDPAAETIVGAIVDLGRRLGLEVIAEGVETEAHVAALRAMGCDFAQGYFYSRPLEPRGFELWIEQHLEGVPTLRPT